MRRLRGVGFGLLIAVAAQGQEFDASQQRAVEAMTLGSDGSLQVEVELASLDPAKVEVLLRVGGAVPPTVPLMITACFGFLDLGDRCSPPVPASTPAEPGRPWEGRLLLDLPDEPVAVGVLAEVVSVDSSGSEQWGTGSADAAADRGLRLADAQLLDLRRPDEIRDPDFGGAWRVIRLVPPPQIALSGTHRFRVLVSDPRVDRVVFEVDGERVASDGSQPFSARIDLGNDGGEHTVAVIALDEDGNELGRDQTAVNPQRVRNRVRLTGTAAGNRLDLEAVLTLAPGHEVQQVEFSYRDRTVAVLREPPYRTSIDTASAGPSDFVQATVTLVDGTRFEDVLLLGAGSVSEEIEVNLTELYAVFFDRATGAVLDQVDAGSVYLTLDGKPIPIERFAPAEERPLTVGLVIDTSNSMYALIPDTQRAAGRFLSGVLRSGDRAFLVDFDTQPRLAHAASEDRRSLISRLAVLSADGFTALFDSIVYATLEFPADGRRRALVVLTDGDDYKSKLGPGNAIEYAEAAGAPVYIISLAGIHLSYQTFGDLRRELEPVRKPDIEKVADATGGRVFYISNPDQLPAAYDRILAELTNQYLVTFSTSHELTEQERASIRLTPAGDEVELRFTVGRE